MMRKKAPDAKEIKEQTKQDEMQWKLEEWSRRRSKISEGEFVEALYDEEFDEEEFVQSIDNLHENSETSEDSSESADIPSEIVQKKEAEQ